MQVFFYKALKENGHVVEGYLEAKDKTETIVKLQNMGYTPVRIVEGGKEKRLFQSFSRKKKIKQKDLLMFTQELSTLLNAGLPIDRSLMILQDITESEGFKETIRGILNEIKGGKSLAEALEKYPTIFPKIYVNMVKAGEVGGVLSQVLNELTGFLERANELRTFLITSMIYPVIILIMMIVSLLVMFLFVIPKFANVFETSGMPIPFAMKVLMTISDIFSLYWWVIILIIGGGVTWFKRWKNTKSGKKKWDEKLLRFKAIGDLIKKIEIERFARTFGTLLKNGVPMITSLNIVKEVIDNVVISEAIEPIKNSVKKGESLAKAMKQADIFPPLSVHLLEVGEETGDISGMLIQVADIFSRDIKVEIKRFIGILEPAMIVFLGLVVGVIVMTMVVSIFSMTEISI